MTTQNIKAADSFPEPPSEVLSHSDQLKQHITQFIRENGGKISFADYMNLALYAPGLGYYSAGVQKFGALGDFITAPEVSSFFSRCLALQCCHLMQQLNCTTILEAGAGAGTMAIDIMQELEQQQQLPNHYYILELSAELRDRQQHHIQQRIPHLFDRFQWLDKLPETNFSGIILANELLDAMPIHILKLESEQTYERFVAVNEEGNFFWLDEPPQNPRLCQQADAIRQLHQSLAQLAPNPEQTYITEVNLQATDWIKSIGDVLSEGALLLIDYGYTAREYYHPQRHMGTLMCHYQHHRHDDPFYLPGMQDITAHIDFSSIAQAAKEVNMTVSGFTTQAHFLMSGGLVELTKDLDPNDVAHFAEMARQIKLLTLPEEMGELFKVILLAKGKKLSLPAFQAQDFSYRL